MEELNNISAKIAKENTKNFYEHAIKNDTKTLYWIKYFENDIIRESKNGYDFLSYESIRFNYDFNFNVIVTYFRKKGFKFKYTTYPIFNNDNECRRDIEISWK